MLSSDHSQHRAGQRRRALAPWEPEQSFDPEAPWDDRSAEALTRLYESEEGRLSRPAAAGRARPQHPRAADTSSALPAAPETVDRTWMEAHLTRLVERLQDSLAQASPEPSLDALNGRLETIEQRFGATLGRVARRADLDGLHSIEAHVLQLAGQLERARERLEQIGAVDEHVRDLAHKLDEAEEQRTSGLERLLRDCMSEWREGEQRTASALQSLEEAVGRLGDAVDAMEASKPAPELTVPGLTGSELGRAAGAAGTAFGGTPFHGEGDRPATPPLYHAMLDAADYAPRPFSQGAVTAGPPSPASGHRTTPADIDVWPPGTGTEPDQAAESRPSWKLTPRLTQKLTPGARRIMALRAKLRQAPVNGHNGHHATSVHVPPVAAAESHSAAAIRRASLSLLLMAGAAFAAGSTYLVYQTFAAVAPAAPAAIERSTHPTGIQSDLSAPIERRAPGRSAG